VRERDVDLEKPAMPRGDALRTMPRGDAESYIGFASLPNQVYRKSVKRGFEFNLMVVGELVMHIIIYYKLFLLLLE